MLVRDWMSKTVIAVNAEDSIQDAVQLLKANGIKMLPVLDQGKLAGIITDRDIKRASASDASSLEIHELIYLLSKLKIKEVMTPDPITVAIDATIEETAQVLLANKISGVPVMEPDGTIAGIISQTDLFSIIASWTGVEKTGIQMALQAPDQNGMITEVLGIVRQNGGHIMSVFSSNAHTPEGFCRIYIRTYDIDPNQLESLKTALQEKTTLLYIVDYQRNHREIY